MGRGFRIGYTNPGTYSLSALHGSYGIAGQDTALNYSAGGSLSADGVTGNFEEGGSLTIAYDGVNGFGSTGPTVALWHHMNSGTNNADVAAADPEVGDYDSIASSSGSGLAPKYTTSFKRSGTTSVKLYDGSQGDTNPRRLIKDFSAVSTAKVRFWLFIPDGKALPDASVGSYSPANSSYKLCWIAGQRDGGAISGVPDLCIPTFTGGSSAKIDGNEGSMPFDNTVDYDEVGPVSSIFRYGQWCMFETLLEAEDPDNARMSFRTCDAVHGVQVQDSGTIEGFWGSTSPQQWASCNLPGYVRTEGYPDTVLYHADYCIYTGPNADCDVLLGNASAYTSCTDLRHLRITSWSNISITCAVTGVDSVNLTGWYLYVRKADGNFVPYSGSNGRVIL